MPSTPAQFLFLACLAFIGGIFIHSIFSELSLQWYALFLLGGSCLLLFFLNRRVGLAGFSILLFLFLGIVRYEITIDRIRENELLSLNERKEEFLILGKVAGDPEEREKTVQLIVQPEGIQNGKILVTTEKSKLFSYGDVIKLRGVLESPPDFEDFHYRKFLLTQGMYSLMYYPEIELVERGRYERIWDVLYAKILQFKQIVRDTIFYALPSPQNTILAAVILGDQGRISDELKEQWNLSGVRHILAISGQNVTILSTMVMSFLIWAGLWRGQAFYATIVLIAFFVLLTGAEASAVRAGIMGGMFLLGQHLGRMSVSLRAVVFAAALMLFGNPLLLLSDVGFQLSFAAVLSIIFFFPYLEKFFSFFPKLLGFRNIFLMTLAAQVFTVPLVIYHFHYVSLVSIPANLFVGPAIPFLIAFGFLLVTVGSLHSFIAFFLSVPLFLLLSYLVSVVEFFAKLPFASYPISDFPVWSLFLFYLLLAFFLWKTRKERTFVSPFV